MDSGWCLSQISLHYPKVACTLGKGMWKLNVMTIIKSNMNKVSTYIYMLELSNLWHGRLGYVNYDTLCRLINLNHIPNFQINAKNKCETCVEAKQIRSSFQSVERHIEPLDLIHSDIYDLKFVQQEVVINVLLPLLMTTPSIVICTYLKSKDRRWRSLVFIKTKLRINSTRKL